MINFREGVTCDVVEKDGITVVRLLQPYLNDDRHHIISREETLNSHELCKTLNCWANRWGSAGYFRCVASYAVEVLKFAGDLFMVTFFAVAGLSLLHFLGIL